MKKKKAWGCGLKLFGVFYIIPVSDGIWIISYWLRTKQVTLEGLYMMMLLWDIQVEILYLVDILFGISYLQFLDYNFITAKSIEKYWSKFQRHVNFDRIIQN